MDIRQEISQALPEVIAFRRAIHAFAEVGFELPKTVAYVKEELTKMGYEPKEVGEGISALCGAGEKTILLRADMDALPMEEKSGLSFAAEKNCHACGHDLHTATLLGTALVLKKLEKGLPVQVKFMFQPAEELQKGAQKMIEAGILEDPKVDCAFMFHVDSTLDPGIYLHSGVMASTNNNFTIEIQGKGAHGAMPENGIDPISIGAHIVLGFQELTSRELAFRNSAVISVCHFESGSANNIIPDAAFLEGTARTYDPSVQEYLTKRMVEIAENTAKTYRGEAKLTFVTDTPVTKNSEELKEKVHEILKEALPVFKAEPVGASEDFAYITQKVPALMMMLGAGVKEDRYPLHNPKVLFNEESMALGIEAFVRIVQGMA